MKHTHTIQTNLLYNNNPTNLFVGIHIKNGIRPLTHTDGKQLKRDPSPRSVGNLRPYVDTLPSVHYSDGRVVRLLDIISLFPPKPPSAPYTPHVQDT